MARAADIQIRTGLSGTVRGRLHGFSSDSRLPHSQKFQQTFSAHLESTIRQGDSGSLVCDADTGSVFGHVVAASQTGKVAILVPATSVLASIKDAADLKILNMVLPDGPRLTETALRHLQRALTDTRFSSDISLWLAGTGTPASRPVPGASEYLGTARPSLVNSMLNTAVRSSRAADPDIDIEDVEIGESRSRGWDIHGIGAWCQPSEG
jgi:hypothetical protein